MSLQRRIAAASAIGVAAVCLIFAPVGYLFTRAKMYRRGQTARALRIAAPYLHPPRGPQPGSTNNGGGTQRSVCPHGNVDSQPIGNGSPATATMDDGRAVCAFSDVDDREQEAFGGATGYFQIDLPQRPRPSAPAVASRSCR